jgi:hypothetical protein
MLEEIYNMFMCRFMCMFMVRFICRPIHKKRDHIDMVSFTEK